MAEVIIGVENITKSFGQVKAVDDISFEVYEGEICGFLGPNGAGKTTTLRMLMGLLLPDNGSIRVLGKNATVKPEDTNKDIGYLSGEVHLYENWTGYDHIRFIKELRKGSKFADSLVELLDFDPSIKAKTLSSGNRQKLGIILALIHSPKVIILDEPTNALDPLLQNTLYDYLFEMVHHGSTVFMSSHNLSEVERVCERVCVIKQGKIVAVDNVAELSTKRIFSVRLHLGAEEEEVVTQKLTLDGVEIINKADDVYELSVRGDIQPLIKSLAGLNINDITINHASLEKIFMEYYR